MSITLITAAPGAGKTIHVVWNIIKPALEQGRVIYTAAIPELKLPTIRVSYNQIKQWPAREKIETPGEYQKDIPEDEVPERLLNFQEGSIIIVDEVQNLWPSTGSRDAPEDITYLSKHRHHGLEIILITQAPQLVHQKVLAIVDKHIHMVADWTGRKMYEWPEYCATPRAVSSKLRAVKNRYDIPRQAFGLYRSASIHIKPARKKPAMFFLTPLLLLALPVMAYMFHNRIYVENANSHAEKVVEYIEQTDQVKVNDEIIINRAETRPVNNIQEKLFIPVTNALVSNNVDWEKVGACLSTKDKCICYGHNAERLVIPPETCRIAAQHGWPGKNVVITATNL